MSRSPTHHVFADLGRSAVSAPSAGAITGVLPVPVVSRPFKWLRRRPAALIVLGGSGLIPILYFLPGGFGSSCSGSATATSVGRPNRHDLIVPSLVAAPTESRRRRAASHDASARPPAPADETAVISGPLDREPPAAVHDARRGLRPGADPLRGRLRGRPRARSSPCSAPTAPASRRCSRASAGLLEPRRGRVALRGQRHHGRCPTKPIAQRGHRRSCRAGSSVFPTLSVAENLRLACWLSASDQSERVAAARREVLELFPHPRPSARHSWRATSPAASSRCWRWPGAHARAEAAADRRAVARPGADDRRPALDVVREIHADGH